MTRRSLSLALLLALAAAAPAGWPTAAPAQAHDMTAGDLTLVRPWTRATPGGARVAGGYLTIRNAGSVPDRLISGTMEAAGRVEIHEMAVTDGVMRMRSLPQGLTLPPGGAVELRPGSYHVMFLDLARPLRPGESVRGTLVFERAGTVEVTFQVEAMGATMPGPRAGHGHGSGHGQPRH